MVFIKDGKTFVTKWSGEYDDCSNVPLGSDDNNSGTITFSLVINGVAEGDLLIIDNDILFISAVAPDPISNTTSVTVKDILNVFRYVYPSNFGNYTDTKDYVYNIIRYHYASQPDTYYKLPYMKVEKDQTAGLAKIKPIEPDYAEGTLIDEGSYIRKCCIGDIWTRGIRINTTYDKDNLNFFITNRNDTYQKIVFSDGEHELVSKNLDKDTTTKVTVYLNVTYRNGDKDVKFHEQSVSGVDGITYYLMPDGQLTRDTAPSNYIAGKWVTRMEEQSASLWDSTKAYEAGSIVVKSATEKYLYRCNAPIPENTKWSYSNWTRYAEYIAYKEISENVDTYKVEFKSKNRYEWQQRVTILFEDGKIFNGIITSVSYNSDDDRYSYTVGNLPVKITEIMKKRLENPKFKTGTTVINNVNNYQGTQATRISEADIDSIVM